MVDESELQAHFNYDLGLPYAPKGGSLSQAIVQACQRRYKSPDTYEGPAWVTAGVDVGRVLHVRISKWPAPGQTAEGRAVPMNSGTLHDFRELARLWERYNVNFGVVDERHEEKQARDFAESHPGRVMLARWSGGEQREDLVLHEDLHLTVSLVPADRRKAKDGAEDEVDEREQHGGRS